MAITISQIVGTLMTHAEDEFPSLTFQFPSEDLDTDALAEWVELDISSFRRQVARIGHPDQWDVMIRLDLYVKNSTSQYRYLSLSKDLSVQFRHKELSIKDFATVGDPETGRLRIYEPKRINGTRAMNESLRTNIRVLRWRIPAYAQSI